MDIRREMGNNIMIDLFLDHPFVLPIIASAIALLSVLINVLTIIFGPGWL